MNAADCVQESTPETADEDDDEGSDSVESRLKFMDDMERRAAANEPSSDSSYRVLSADTDVCACRPLKPNVALSNFN